MTDGPEITEVPEGWITEGPEITEVPEGWMTEGPEALITEVPLVPPLMSASSLVVRGRMVSRESFRELVAFFMSNRARRFYL
ncbi:MAG: hypothetical protein WKG01_27225 [Kofleriaceae bacterium]